MADLDLGCFNVNVVLPPHPVFRVERPVTQTHIVLPVQGPPGPAGAGAIDDTAIAFLISDENSEVHGALIPVIEDTVEPPVNLNILLENSLA